MSIAVKPRATEPVVAPFRAGAPHRRRGFAWPACLTAIVLLGAAMPASPLRDLVSGAVARGAHLTRPAAYVALAPVSDVLDMLTLFSTPQHAALVVTLVLIHGLWRLARHDSSDGVKRRVWNEARGAARSLLCLLAVYGAMIALPRPMARLTLDDPTHVSIDFHSHTNESHDARTGFTVAANRSWHVAAGYGAAYISDHHSFRGAHEGLAGNPSRAGDGTMLLPALEAAYHGEHVIVLGSSHGPRSAPVRQWADSRLPEDAGAGLLMTVPGSVAPFRRGVRQTRVLGIELSDASPQGLAEADIKRDSIVALATTLGAALLTGSDNHGWGHAAVSWSVMSIPDWRVMTADTLDARVRATLAREGTRAVTPIARSRVESRSVASLVTVAPAAAWLMVRTLSWAERGVWIAWIWAAAFLLAAADTPSRVRRRARLRILAAEPLISD